MKFSYNVIRYVSQYIYQLQNTQNMREGKHNSIEGHQKMHPKIQKYEFNSKFVKVPLVDVDKLKEIQKTFVPKQTKRQISIFKNYESQAMISCSKLHRSTTLLLQFIKTNFPKVKLQQQDQKKIRDVFDFCKEIIQHFRQRKLKDIKKAQQLLDEQIKKINKDTSLDNQQKKKQIQEKKMIYYTSEQFDQEELSKVDQLNKIIQKYIENENIKQYYLQNYQFSDGSIYHDLVQAAINFIACKDDWKNIKFMTPFNIQVDASVFKNLEPGGWLTSANFDSIFSYLKQIQGVSNKALSDKCVFSHTETNSYLSDYHNVKITSFNRAALLVNANNSHWYVIGVFNDIKAIIIYDSMFNEKNYDYYLGLLQKQIQKQTGKGDNYRAQIEKNNIGQQNNTSDCGVFSTLAIMHILDDTFEDKFKKNIKVNNSTIVNLRKAYKLWIGYLGWCQENSQSVRADVFNYLIRQTIFTNKVYRQNGTQEERK